MRLISQTLLLLRPNQSLTLFVLTCTLLLTGCARTTTNDCDREIQGAVDNLWWNSDRVIGIAGTVIFCYPAVAIGDGIRKAIGIDDTSETLHDAEAHRIVYLQQLLDLIPNSTYSGRSERGTQFDVYSRQDGRMIGPTASGTVDEGIWEITNDGKYCRQWDNWRDVARDCFYVYLVDNDGFQFKAIGEPYKSIGQIVPGDPEHLKSGISTPEGGPLIVAAAVASGAYGQATAKNPSPQ